MRLFVPSNPAELHQSCWWIHRLNVKSVNLCGCVGDKLQVHFMLYATQITLIYKLH